MNNNYINKYTENYSNIKDEDLIRKIKSGDNDALDYILNKYQEVVNMKVSRYFIIGAEKEDIIQEGLIGLYKAIKSFDPEKQNSFKSFANLCIERQLITAIKSSNRQKHMPLNSYLSLNMSAYDNEDDDTSIYDIFDANIIEDPLDTITKKEYYKSVEDIIDKSLSIFEKNVLNELVNGSSYTAIAQKLDSPVKSVDNAIQRIRKKTMKNLNLENKRKNNKRRDSSTKIWIESHFLF